VSAEFTPTGAPDIANGKGTPAKVVLFVDGEPVGEGDLPVDDLKEQMRQILARQ
jgi:arylsulfatase